MSVWYYYARITQTRGVSGTLGLQQDVVPLPNNQILVMKRVFTPTVLHKSGLPVLINCKAVAVDNCLHQALRLKDLVGLPKNKDVSGDVQQADFNGDRFLQNVM